MDSVVLLHLLHTLAPRFEWRLSALHVHHGISSNADSWVDFCSKLCERYSIPLHIERVDIAFLRNEHGIEAAARKLRHAAFAEQSCDFVTLAHHIDDQAETLLLQLLRGAGVKGVAAMPVLNMSKRPVIKSAVAHAPSIVRPLLDIPRATLLDHARQYGLDWIEDESNADDQYPRNFLRHRVLPLLEQRFPAYRETLARDARHFAEAGELLDDLAQLDAQGLLRSEPLPLSLLRDLSPVRGKNLLRYFLHLNGAPMPQTVQIDDMLRQLIEARQDAAVCVEFGEWQVRRYRDQVHVMLALGDFDPDLVLAWQGESEMFWPALNERVNFVTGVGQGISLSKVKCAPLTLHLRRGGEALRPHPAAATRSLKNLLQEHFILPWRRERIPLLYCGDELVSVIGVAVHADYQARESEESVLVSLE